MRGNDYSEAVEFLKKFFGETTAHAVELRSCSNVKGEQPTKRLFSRDMAMIETHCRNWDDLGRGMYFGVCTRIRGSHQGRREDLSECPALWVDIDTRKHGLDKNEVADKLASLPNPPSFLIDSGGGLHGYWCFSESVLVDLSTGGEKNESLVTMALKDLAAVCGGDPTVCDLTRIMRLPGTHNTKSEVMGEDNEPYKCTVKWDHGGTYELEELIEWLSWQRPIIELPTIPKSSNNIPPTATPSDPFTHAANAAGYHPPLDVQKALEEMIFQGHGDTGVHQTQLKVSASLVSNEVEDEKIVSILLEATKNVAPGGARWDWGKEEAGIREMVVSAKRKFLGKPLEVHADEEAAEENVVNLSKVREQKKAAEATGGGMGKGTQRKPRGSKGPGPIVKCGETVIAYWKETRGNLMLTEGQPWVYKDGWWKAFDDELDHILRVSIQGVVRAMNLEPKASLVGNVRKYVLEHPNLLREGVTWNVTGKIACLDGSIDPTNGARSDHSERDYSRYQVAADINPDKKCPIWLAFLNSAFSNLEEKEQAAVESTLAEWFGSALVRGKNRNMTKGLLVYGPSYSGKTQLANVLRALIGGGATGVQACELEQHFGRQTMINVSAWIADDAFKSGEYLNAESYKTIVTGEPVSIPRKNRPNWEGRLDIPVLLTSNHLPRIKDQSSAVYKRSLVLPMTVVHDEHEVAEKSVSEMIIENELGGVLNWAIEGYKRLRARGYFEPPEIMTEAIKTFEADNNPIGMWVKDAIVREPGMMVDRNHLLASLNGWMMAEYGANITEWKGRSAFPALRRAMPCIVDKKISGKRYVCGIKLTDEGLDHYQEYVDMNYGNVVGCSDHKNSVNKVIKTRKKGSPDGYKTKDDEPLF